MRRHGLRAVVAVILPFLLFVPPTSAQSRISKDQELQAGRIAAARLIAQHPLLVDPEWLSFLSQLRATLEPYSGRTEINHQIILLDTDVPNAASTPGYLFFTSGLIRLNMGRDAWAFVMAHELAHTARRHVAIEIEKAQAGALVNVLVAVVTGVSLAGDLAELLVRVANLGHSRELEVEADVEGLKMMIEAGFTPDKAVATLQFFNEATGRRQEQSSWSGTHPGYQDRIARLTRAQQQLLDQGLPTRVLYFSTEAASGALKLRPIRMLETAREWIFLIEAQNDAPAAASIKNTSIRLVLTDGKVIEQTFLRSTFPNEVASSAKINGTAVFARPDPSARPARLIIPVTTVEASIDLAVLVESGGPFRPAAPVSTLPKPPGP